MFGTLRKALFVALVLTCLVVAPATTQARGTDTAQTVIATQSGRLTLNGVKFLPIMWQASTTCPDKTTIDQLVNMGVTGAEHDLLGCNGAGDDPATLHAALAGRLWWYERSDMQQLQGLPEMVDWQANNATFYTDGQTMVGCGSKTTTALYAKLVPMVRVEQVVYQVLARENLGPTYTNCLNGSRLAALFWTAMVAGADGFEYSTNLPWDNKQQFDVTTEVQSEAKVLAAQLAVLQPALVAAPVGYRIKGSTTVKATVRRQGNTTYLVAVNTGSTPATMTFTIPSIKSTVASLPWEHRNVKVVKRTLSDKFAPLAVHIYKFLPAKKTKKK